MFGIKFKVILFKMFILSSFEYCSALFFNLSNKVDALRLEKTFAKACNQLLNIRLATQIQRMVKNTMKTIYVDMNLNQQLKTLSPFNLVPLKLRFLYHFVNFLFSNLIKNCKCSLMLRIFRLENLVYQIIKLISKCLHLIKICTNLHLHQFLLNF